MSLHFPWGHQFDFHKNGDKQKSQLLTTPSLRLISLNLYTEREGLHGCDILFHKGFLANCTDFLTQPLNCSADIDRLQPISNYAKLSCAGIRGNYQSFQRINVSAAVTKSISKQIIFM